MSGGNQTGYAHLSEIAEWPVNLYASWASMTRNLGKFPDLNRQPSLPEKETVVGYVEAWRWWGLERSPSGRQCHPRSDTKDSLWLWDGEMVADRLPTAENTHGFYAYNPEGINEHDSCPLFGRVALYGDVVHCKYGYRAEKARILDVWINGDYVHRHPEVKSVLHIPQVRGTFDITKPSVYRADGAKGDYQCLTLESHKELSGTSLWDGQTTPQSPSSLNPIRTMLVIARTGLWYRSDPLTPISSGGILLRGFEPEWVVKPEGDVCPICDRTIDSHEPVAIEFILPDRYEQALYDRTFEWKHVRSHLDCAWASLPVPVDESVEWILGGCDIADRPLSTFLTMTAGE